MANTGATGFGFGGAGGFGAGAGAPPAVAADYSEVFGTLADDVLGVDGLREGEDQAAIDAEKAALDAKPAFLVFDFRRGHKHWPEGVTMLDDPEVMEKLAETIGKELKEELEEGQEKKDDDKKDGDKKDGETDGDVASSLAAGFAQLDALNGLGGDSGGGGTTPMVGNLLTGNHFGGWSDSDSEGSDVR